MGKILEQSRYLGLVGVISLLLSSMTAFGWAALKAIKAMQLIIVTYGKDPLIAISLIEIVDGFLIATALFIFSVSMYELFIAELNLPDWMLAHNLHELKAKLGSVVILVMAIKFAEHFVEWKDPYDTLLFGVAMAIVSLTLIAMGHFGGKD